MRIPRFTVVGCWAIAAALVMTMGQLALGQQQSDSSSFIRFDLACDQVMDGCVSTVRYRCSGPCRVALEVVVAATPRRAELLLFRTRWISGPRPGDHPPSPRWRRVLLRFPPSVMYRRDVSNRRVVEAGHVTVRAWLSHAVSSSSSSASTYHQAVWRDSKVLRTLPVPQRPPRPTTVCPSWSAGLMWRLSAHAIYQCPHESATVDMLTFPLASSGEHFGVVRTFQPFVNTHLERRRLEGVTRPSVTLSVWLYLKEWCTSGRVCSIINHLDANNKYLAPLVHLTKTGDVIIQARLTSGRDEAFSSPASLPLWTWIRLDCFIRDSKVTLDATWDNETHKFTYQFADSILYNDTDGFFVIGGGKSMPGIYGYFGTVRYYRLGADKVNNPLLPERTLQDLSKTHHQCEEIKTFTEAFLHQVTKSHDLASNNGCCIPHYITLWSRYRQQGLRCRQRWSWQTQLKYSTLFRHLQTQEEALRTASWDVRSLYDQAVRGMLDEDQVRAVRGMLDEDQVRAVRGVLDQDQEVRAASRRRSALLEVASCLGDHRASLMLASLHLAGLAQNPQDQEQGHVYSLIGASGDDRLALMHLGYKHTQGIDGFPKDLDVAYSYYSNVAVQSVRDSWTDEKHYPAEHTLLSNQEDLRELLHETSDAFHFLKFQAEWEDDAGAQRVLSRLLLWGQKGVSRDTQSAVSWLERSAMQMTDPDAMFEYSMMLMKGQFVEKNTTLGLLLLEKAAHMGSIGALNGLGWYHDQTLNDSKAAAKYFERAALNGSADGMFNMGVYLLRGNIIPEYPSRNETAAFRYFLNASLLGHGNAALEAAWYLSTGRLQGVSKDEESAVILLKRVCEQNGHLGSLIREALQDYLQGSRGSALLKYVLAAETGLGSAQNNAAYLCEELRLGSNCQWRYTNHSVLNYDAHSSGLLRMGDRYYHDAAAAARQRGRRGDSLSLAAEAVWMYGRAALAGSPQGMFNLAVMAQEGHALPRNVHAIFNGSHGDTLDVLVEKILQRCVSVEPAEGLTPCSLALLRVQVGQALTRMSGCMALLTLAYAALLCFIVAMVTVPIQVFLEHLRIKADQRQASSQAEQQRGTGTSSDDDGDNNSSSSRSSQGEHDDIVGTADTGASRTYRTLRNLRLSALNGQARLREAADLAVSVSGVCLCALGTTLLYHCL